MGAPPGSSRDVAFQVQPVDEQHFARRAPVDREHESPPLPPTRGVGFPGLRAGRKDRQAAAQGDLLAVGESPGRIGSRRGRRRRVVGTGLVFLRFGGSGPLALLLGAAQKLRTHIDLKILQMADDGRRRVAVGDFLQTEHVGVEVFGHRHHDGDVRGLRREFWRADVDRGTNRGSRRRRSASVRWPGPVRRRTGGGEGRQPARNPAAVNQTTANCREWRTGGNCERRTTGSGPNVGPLYPAGHGNRYVFLHSMTMATDTLHPAGKRKARRRTGRSRSGHLLIPKSLGPDRRRPRPRSSLTLPQVERMALLLTALILVGLHLANFFSVGSILARRGGRSRLCEHAFVGRHVWSQLKYDNFPPVAASPSCAAGARSGWRATAQAIMCSDCSWAWESSGPCGATPGCSGARAPFFSLALLASGAGRRVGGGFDPPVWPGLAVDAADLRPAVARRAIRPSGARDRRRDSWRCSPCRRSTRTRSLLLAMGVAGMLVAARAGRWRSVAAVAGIGLAAAVSLLAVCARSGARQPARGRSSARADLSWERFEWMFGVALRFTSSNLMPWAWLLAAVVLGAVVLFVQKTCPAATTSPPERTTLAARRAGTPRGRRCWPCRFSWASSSSSGCPRCRGITCCRWP